jgi:mRNA-degrading endonuclease RelE of RelBE toxin-antitoxin system
VASYRVVLTPAAQRQLGGLRGSALLALRGVILALGTDPFPRGARKLSGSDDVWRIGLRIDGQPWRVVYQLRSRERVLIVTRVARRDEGTYRGL